MFTEYFLFILFINTAKICNSFYDKYINEFVN